MALNVGQSASFRVTDVGNGTITSKTQTIGAVEDVGGAKAGVMANRVTTTKAGGMTVSWQEDTGDGVVRHRELDESGANSNDTIYTPSKPRVDETPAHMTPGATWTVAYTEDVTTTNPPGIPPTSVDKTEDWDTVAVDESITVPAGTFCALHVHRISMVGGGIGSDKNYWFARGFGKVKEVGDSQIEELVQFTP